MSNETDRRAPGTTRIPFEVMVEVGGALGPSFEAQAVDVSEEGMHLRTAYLPEVGQPITCRFDAEATMIEAEGEVVWKTDQGRGGEFGLRFTNLDREGAIALRRLFMPAGGGPGSKVRLHIEGLGSSMRARIRDEKGSRVVAYSELGFLQTGKQLDLEDAATGERRPAHIDHIDVELEECDGAVPQLVISMRYDDVIEDENPEPEIAERPQATDPEPQIPASMMEVSKPVMQATMAPTKEASKDTAEAKDTDDEPKQFKGALAEHAARVGPALNAFATRTKAALALAWANRKKTQTSDDAPAPRRTTSPPPGGGLHASGRKVVRTEDSPDARELAKVIPKLVTKRRAVVAGAVVLTGALAVMAMKKPAAHAPVPEAPVAASTNAIPPPDPLTPATGALATNAMAVSMPPDTVSASGPADKGKKGKPAPFTNGPVGHANVIKIKMDGVIEKIQGASQPTGFTVVLPGRKSVEPASPLASKDSRIGAIRVSNDPNGAELTINFKDGVPNYRVGAKGDTLEISIAQQKAEPKEGAGAKASTKKHGKHH